MLTVDLRQLDKNVRLAVEYLRSRLDEPVKVKGRRVKLTHTSVRAAKLHLQKFFRQLRLEGYRILVVQPGLIEVRTPKKEKESPIRPKKEAKPSAWETIPDLWYTTPPGIIRQTKRSRRKSKRRMRGL